MSISRSWVGASWASASVSEFSVVLSSSLSTWTATRTSGDDALLLLLLLLAVVFLLFLLLVGCSRSGDRGRDAGLADAEGHRAPLAQPADGDEPGEELATLGSEG